MAEYGITTNPLTGLSGSSSDYEVMGYKFTVKNANIRVTALRNYSYNSRSKKLYLWELPSGTKLGEVTISAVANQWVEGAISPVTLTVGKSYVVGAQCLGGWYYKGSPASSLAYHPNITFNEGRYGSTANAMPPNVDSANLYGMPDIVINNGNYKTSGFFLSDPTDYSPVGPVDSAVFSWTEAIPANTTLQVSMAATDDLTPPATYTPITKGVALPDVKGKRYLWLKIAMTTTDITTTPSIKDITAAILPTADNTLVRLKFDPLQHFKNAEGAMKIVYDQNVGNLQGWHGDRVRSFTEEFVPTGLVPVPNPWVTETVGIGVYHVTPVLIDMFYKTISSQEVDKVKFSAILNTLTHTYAPKDPQNPIIV